MGEAFVVVLGHPTYYPRFGFTRASQHGIGLSIDVPDEALMALTLDPTRPLPRGTVHYAEPFGIE
jgi:predicted N-acetyltransferase YhbS